MSKTNKKSSKSETTHPQNDGAATESRPVKRETTRPGKKVISLIVDEKFAARIALCAKAEGLSQTEFVVGILGKGLRARLDSALEALKAGVE